MAQAHWGEGASPQGRSQGEGDLCPPCPQPCRVGSHTSEEPALPVAPSPLVTAMARTARPTPPGTGNGLQEAAALDRPARPVWQPHAGELCHPGGPEGASGGLPVLCEMAAAPSSPRASCVACWEASGGGERSAFAAGEESCKFKEQIMGFCVQLYPTQSQPLSSTECCFSPPPGSL